MVNVEPDKIVIPQPTQEPVAALRESYNLDDLLDEDGLIIVPDDQKEAE